ncbi:MAG: transcriptional regulator FnrL [Paracoccaceae bacterium]
MYNLAAALENVDCGDCPIRYRAVCSRCDQDELEILEGMKSYKSYEADQTIVWAGDQPQFVGSVVEGVAALSQTMEDGRRQMVGLLLPSDFVGRPGRETAPFDVVAATDVKLCRFQKRPFEKMMASTPHVATRLLEMTMDELDAAREWMLLLGRKTAREKIASLLVIVARRDSYLRHSSASGRVRFDLPLSRQAMADYLGLTLETVSRQMSALKKGNLIRLEGKRRVMIPDFAELLNEAGDDSDGGTLA